MFQTDIPPFVNSYGGAWELAFLCRKFNRREVFFHKNFAKKINNQQNLFSALKHLLIPFLLALPNSTFFNVFIGQGWGRESYSWLLFYVPLIIHNYILLKLNILYIISNYGFDPLERTPLLVFLSIITKPRNHTFANSIWSLSGATLLCYDWYII